MEIYYKEKNSASSVGLPKNPYGKLTNDFMFKRIFGTESTKDVLIMFLNQMIGEPRIVDVTIRNNEQLGMTSEDRKAVFDITCHTDADEHFIVEMQHASQEYFRERATFYTSYPTIEQGMEAKRRYYEEQGTTAGFAWDFNLRPIKFIAILSFRMDHSDGWPEDRFLSSYHIREDWNNELMHDCHQYIFLELPRFGKNAAGLENDYDRWVFLFKNMHKFHERPSEFSGKEYDRLFELSKIANFTPQEFKNYMDAEIMFNDNQNCLNFAEKRGYLKGYDEGVAEGREKWFEEGREEGRQVGREEGREVGREEGRHIGMSDAVRKMASAGMSADRISSILDLALEDVKTILGE